MNPLDTSLGGEERRFPKTRWSMLRAARDPGSPEHLRALEDLCRAYWKPVYLYLRAARRLGNEEAKDLTQGFFMDLLDGGLLVRYRPEESRFGNYLRGAIQLFLRERHRSEARLKRGGGRFSLSLDEGEDGRLEQLLADPGKTPEELFDLEWARCVCAQAVEDLRVELEGEGKSLYFQVYKKLELERVEAARPRYAPIALELGLKETDVANYLRVCRRRLRMKILDRIREYVETGEEVGPELGRILELLSTDHR